MSPVSVLYCIDGPLDDGRVTEYAMRYVYHTDPARVQIDFLVRGMDKGAREDEARALGCRVYHVPRFWSNPFKHIADTMSVLRYGGYTIVEAHMDARSGMLLAMARRAGVPVRVAMSHSVRLPRNSFSRRLLLRLARPLIRQNATHLFARSTLAGRFLYGRKAVDAGRVHVYKDAILLDRFAFDPAARASLRSKLHVADSYLIGHVGRFDPLKNYTFLVDTFSILSRRMENAVLVLVGSGKLYGDIIRRIRDRGIEDRVRLLGFREDVPQLLSAFDCFVLPSRAEGLPVTVIEAQMSGLPCVVSLAVPTEACVADLTFVPLTDVEAWLAAIRAHAGQERQGAAPAPFTECGFDIMAEAARRQQFYETSHAAYAGEAEDADEADGAVPSGGAEGADGGGEGADIK